MLARIPVRRAALVALLALVVSGAGAAPPKRSCDYWLFSWKVRGGAYHFAVMPQSERAAFLANFPTVLSIKSMAELEMRLKALPKNLTVGWSELPCLQITYPPNDIARRIQRFAAENHIMLLMIPGACE